jgi:hypothetical protein
MEKTYLKCRHVLMRRARQYLSIVNSPVHGEDVFEVSARVDEEGEAVSQHGRVLTVQDERPVHHVQEQLQVVGPCERTLHGLEHREHQLKSQGMKQIVYHIL